MEKSELCKDCPGLAWAGPVPSEFTHDEVDVIFLGEAPGYSEVVYRKPFVGRAGKILRTTLAQLPEISRYGICNVWACKPPGDKLPEGVSPGEYCKRRLAEELTTHNQKVIVALGGTALSVFLSDVGITAVQRRLFTVSLNGSRMPVLACYHPSYISRRGHEWRDWELAFDKLLLFLRSQYTYIPPSQRKVHSAVEVDQAIQWLKKLADMKELAVDIETSAGYSPWAGARILTLSIAWSFTEAVAFNWLVFEQSEEAFRLLKGLLENPQIVWVYYNGQYDTIFLRSVGIEPVIGRDAMLEAATVDERGDIHSLKRDAAVFLDAPDWEADVRLYVSNRTDSYELVPMPKLLEYNGLDAMYTLQLSHTFQRYLSEEGELDYCRDILFPTFDLLSEARYVGIRVDVRRLAELRQQIQPTLDDLTHQAAELTGMPHINLNSPRDKLKALHGRGIMVPDTRRETLEQYEGDELVDIIRAYMDASKIFSTYLTPDYIYDDLRVHPDWKTPTENGRPRCSNPNLLGIPRKAEVEEHRWKRFVKEIYIADPGTVFLYLDRKQSEVRCEVFLARAENFIESLRKDPESDIHGMFTKMLYGPNYTKEQRVLVKMIVFGLIYNRGAPSLARQFTAIERQKARKEGRGEYKVWTVSEAQRFIDDFFKLFPELLSYRRWCMETVKKTGRLTDFFGRVRHFGMVTLDNQQHMMNQAVNYPPSSLSAGLNFLSCIETRKRFKKYGVVVLVPIHDAALIRLPKDSAESLAAEIKGLWEELVPKVLKYNIPFPCDASLGERWSDL